MKKLIFPSVLLALLVSHVSIATAASCESLASMKFPDATVTAAQSAGGICKVALTLKPSGDSAIKVELWLPESTWNGKFEAVGNGDGTAISPPMPSPPQCGEAMPSHPPIRDIRAALSSLCRF